MPSERDGKEVAALRAAVFSHPDDPDAWCGLVVALVGRGRCREAGAAWREASVLLGGAHPHGSLHRWVATACLRRSELDLAREVLDGVPVCAMASDPDLSALADLLAALDWEADVGSVFPLGVPPERWWDGPHLGDRVDVGLWLPGCVESADAEGVRILVAIPADVPPDRAHGWVDMSCEEFARRSAPGRPAVPGTFVELHFVDGDPEPVILSHPAERPLAELFRMPEHLEAFLDWRRREPTSATAPDVS